MRLLPLLDPTAEVKNSAAMRHCFALGAGGIRDLFLQSKNKFATPRFWSGSGKILPVIIFVSLCKDFLSRRLKKEPFC